MKHINLLRFLGAAVCVTFASCESTWPYGASDTESRRGAGYSLDNPPSSQSRYLQGPASTTSPGAATTTTQTTETTTTTPPPDSVQPSTTTTTTTTETLPQPPPPPTTTTTAPASYGSPVPGRKGFVYPPGSDQKPENMVDVRDFTPGQKVRDPRTGKVFLVP
ncbi:hypothetical protein DES53_104350 [Roseimicrobium gellanilyticum]|uniref:YD repeat-containing protein n=1 Tax=Roseimicrobium gellanilyticum TaxID=748857 RepID=A0A366HMZ7_9BACT|nr:hypothetical protein [Roseimicrobium gellanilyticum]RBP44529.1 hypothetical protein DES53_104350 [Roseimicrobium gellanilyticum]